MLRSLIQQMMQFFKGESGQGVAEYGSVLALVAILVVVGFGTFKGSASKAISSSYNSVVTRMNTAAAATVRK